MQVAHGIIRSDDKKLTYVCQEIGEELGISFHVDDDLATFLIALQSNAFAVCIFDSEESATETLNWVKVIRKMRPKVPLIVICDQLDSCMGAKYHEQGVFYVCVRPFHRSILSEVLTAALKRSSDQYVDPARQHDMN